MAKAVTKKRLVKKAEDVRTKKRNLSLMQNQNGEPVVQLATRVPKTAYRELKLYAVSNNKSISDLITEFIGEGLVKRNWKFQKAS